jgi:hypothetical protein
MWPPLHPLKGSPLLRKINTKKQKTAFGGFLIEVQCSVVIDI